MLQYEIEGGNLPVVICHPEAGQTLCTQRGAMSWMSPNIQMSTNTGGGLKKVFGRMLSGESVFLNEFTPIGGKGTVAFASDFPGSIIPFEVRPNRGIIVQKGAFLAMEKGLELSVWLQKKLRHGFFGGEGFIMQKISGSGLVFLEIDGYCKKYTLQAGESILVDTGYLAAMSETCSMEIETVKGAANIFFGGEGLFHTRVTGPGEVYLQSMPLIQTAQALAPYITVHTERSDNDRGGINIRLGD